jgi:hypothetical protein
MSDIYTDQDKASGLMRCRVLRVIVLGFLVTAMVDWYLVATANGGGVSGANDAIARALFHGFVAIVFASFAAAGRGLYGRLLWSVLAVGEMISAIQMPAIVRTGASFRAVIDSILLVVITALWIAGRHRHADIL